LVVKHRPLNANEFRIQRFREKMLEPPCEEDEEEDEAEVAEPAQEATTSKTGTLAAGG
jgi:RNA polymerase II-associated factor 1